MADPGELSADVVVVGAGPAGLSAARAAASLGASTLLLERNNEIGIPVRTSGATWIEDMRRLGVPDRFWHPTRKVRLAGPAREVRFHYDPPINCVLDVRGLYQHLAEEASRRGARVRVRSRVEAAADGSLAIAFPEGNVPIRSKVVIDASGAAAIVARARGLALAAPGRGDPEARASGPGSCGRRWSARPPCELAAGSRRVGVGAELELFAPMWDPEELWLVVGSAVAPGGYAWVFPAGGGRVRAGVGVLSPGSGADPAPHLRRFVSRTPVLAAAAEIEYHRGVIPSDGPMEATVADGLLVAGDAAGQVLATAGEGIRFCLELGGLAGEVAARAALSNDTSAAALSVYEAEWSRRYRGLFELADRINRKLSGLDDEGWDAALGWMETLGRTGAAHLMRGDVLSSGFARTAAEWFMPAFARLAGI